MVRWLMLGIAATAMAMLLGACGGEDEAGTASPAATATAMVQATGTTTARPSDEIPSVGEPGTTPRPLPPTPTPPPLTPTAAVPTPEVRQPQWTVIKQPSDGQMQILVGDGISTYIMATVDPQWTQLESWDVEFVADLNADGMDEAIVTHYTGGAHCCFEYWIFHEGPSAIQFDDAFSLTNGAIGAVQDLDGDGVPEMDGSDDRLAYFPDLSFADSPFLPLILCRTADGAYSDCTSQFPQRLQESAQDYEQALSEAVQRGGEDYEKRSPALGLLASYMRLGRDGEGWSKVASLCPECETWLRQNQGELETRLRLEAPAPVGQ